MYFNTGFVIPNPESHSPPDPVIADLTHRDSFFPLETLPGEKQKGCLWQADR